MDHIAIKYNSKGEHSIIKMQYNNSVASPKQEINQVLIVHGEGKLFQVIQKETLSTKWKFHFESITQIYFQKSSTLKNIL